MQDVLISSVILRALSFTVMNKASEFQTLTYLSRQYSLIVKAELHVATSNGELRQR